METLKSLRDQTADWLDDHDTETLKRIDAALNQAHAKRLTETDWDFMLMESTLSLTSGVREYTLHQDFLRPLYFRDSADGQWYRQVPKREVEGQNLNWNSDKDAKKFALWGRSVVTNQLTTPSKVTIVSDSSADVGSTKSLLIYGETADGVTTESINPNGTNPVEGLITFTKILRVTKSSLWAGKMTMTAGAITILTLFASEAGRSYPKFVLLASPGSGRTVEYRFYRKPYKMENDYDVPDIPDPYCLVLVWDALLMMTAYDGRMDAARKAEWEKNQREIDAQMRNDFLEGRGIGAVIRKVRDTVGDDDE